MRDRRDTMTLYEPKWSAPGDGTNTEPGEYEAWLEFKALVEAGHLVPVEPDYDKHYALMQQWSGTITRDHARILLNSVLGIEETP